ncbi:MAG TPA: biotin/lipoyl-containing protein [Chloroflexota bacterium]|nr:biotin/lipoyl-containing protein [Chloroflexota bacterium]
MTLESPPEDRDSGLVRERGPLSPDELGELLRVLAGSDVEELDLECEGARLWIRRDPAMVGRGLPEISEPMVEATPPDTFVVTAPMVGVFRRSAGGKSEPPVEEGGSIIAGQVVGAVEAMRMLNRVQSERAGVVKRLLVQDGQPVEYGQPLIELRPS